MCFNKQLKPKTIRKRWFLLKTANFLSPRNHDLPKFHAQGSHTHLSECAGEIKVFRRAVCVAEVGDCTQRWQSYWERVSGDRVKGKAADPLSALEIAC